MIEKIKLTNSVNIYGIGSGSFELINGNSSFKCLLFHNFVTLAPFQLCVFIVGTYFHNLQPQSPILLRHKYEFEIETASFIE
jgi:hypothetical protein